MTDALLETFARAYDRESAAQCGDPSPWDMGGDPVWREERIACARAALEAMREAGYVVVPAEPTEAMVLAATSNFRLRREWGPGQYMAAQYRAMIAAAQEDT